MHIDQKTVLVVEDDDHKLRAIENFLRDLSQSAKIEPAQSLSSAIAKISGMKIDFSVIDMSIPTYDFAVDKAGGGQPQGLGGEDLLRFIESESSETYAVVLTQHEEFQIPGGGIKTLQQLSVELTEELGERFLGVVHYDGQHGEWRNILRSAIEAATKDSNGN